MTPRRRPFARHGRWRWPATCSTLVEELSSVKGGGGCWIRRRWSRGWQAGACRSTTKSPRRAITTSSRRCTNPFAAAISRRGALLAGADAGGPGEQPLFHRPPPGARRRWRISAWADPQAVHQAGWRPRDVFDFLGSPGRRTGPGAMRALSGQRPQIQCGFIRRWGWRARRAAEDSGSLMPPAPYPQRPPPS